MRIRAYESSDLVRLLDLTIETFGPFYEGVFRPTVGDTIFRHQHGNWQDDYRAQLPTLHDPDHDKYVAVAEHDGDLVAYVAWQLDLARRHGEIEILAVAAQDRGQGTATELCQYAFGQMKDHGVDVATIGTGGDTFHTPARSLYESLGCTPVPVTIFFKEL